MGRRHAVHARRHAAVTLWFAGVAGLVLFRIGLPVLVRAHAGSALPLLPRYDDVPLNGDANGYYEAVSNIIDSYEQRAASTLLAVCRRTDLDHRWVGGPCGAAAALTLGGAHRGRTRRLRHGHLHRRGCGTAGRTRNRLASALDGIHVAAALARAHDRLRVPVRARAFPRGERSPTTLGTAYLGYFATGRRAVGLVAAALYSFWPVWVGIVAGERAWENGQWHVDVGLNLYTEPISTALVSRARALLLRPTLGATRAAGAGIALGFATVVKLTDGLLAVAFLPLIVFRHGIQTSHPVHCRALGVAANSYHVRPKGYVGMYNGATAPVATPWSLHYARFNWQHSTIFTPTMIILIGLPADSRCSSSFPGGTSGSF